MVRAPTVTYTGSCDDQSGQSPGQTSRDPLCGTSMHLFVGGIQWPNGFSATVGKAGRVIRGIAKPRKFGSSFQKVSA